LLVSKIVQKLLSRCGGKVVRGPWKKPSDFVGDLDLIMSGLELV